MIYHFFLFFRFSSVLFIFFNYFFSFFYFISIFVISFIFFFILSFSYFFHFFVIRAIFQYVKILPICQNWHMFSNLTLAKIWSNSLVKFLAHKKYNKITYLHQKYSKHPHHHIWCNFFFFSKILDSYKYFKLFIYSIDSKKCIYKFTWTKKNIIFGVWVEHGVSGTRLGTIFWTLSDSTSLTPPYIKTF